MLCGCTQKKNTIPILNNISFIAEINYSNDKFVCESSLSDGDLKLIVKEPAEIKDLILVANKNGVAAEFLGVSYNADIISLPQRALAKLLFNILTDICNNESVTCDDGNCKITGRVDCYKYVFDFSPSGLPISLEVDELDLKIDFKNVTVN